uniref:TSA: Wollemia nobilis Ref_Wollemi_Transcript_6281_909 transcribed RNA sequence n=1 Tax=Wollemia nobilis TaxID=56998 RepID=A0A0C9RXC7_9CONI
MADYGPKSLGDRHNIEVVKGKEYSSQVSSSSAAAYNGGRSSSNSYAVIGHSQSYSEPGSNPGGTYSHVKGSKNKSMKAWGFSDPEVKRRKRVASYKVYSVEGKMKASFCKSFRWIKDKYTEIVQGW